MNEIKIDEMKSKNKYVENKKFSDKIRNNVHFIHLRYKIKRNEKYQTIKVFYFLFYPNKYSSARKIPFEMSSGDGEIESLLCSALVDPVEKVWMHRNAETAS